MKFAENAVKISPMYQQKRQRKSRNQTYRLKIYKQSHGRCWYCGIKIGKKSFRLDHQEPFSKGGADSKRNLVASCADCDSLKGAQTLEEFRCYLERKERSRVVFHGESQNGARWKHINNQA